MKKHEQQWEKWEKEGSEQWNKIKEEYSSVLYTMHKISNPTLFLLCIVGASMVVYFDTIILKFPGLILFAYGVYIFAMREGHRDGYFDHYTNNSTHEKEIDTKQ